MNQVIQPFQVLKEHCSDIEDRFEELLRTKYAHIVNDHYDLEDLMFDVLDMGELDEVYEQATAQIMEEVFNDQVQSSANGVPTISSRQDIHYY